MPSQLLEYPMFQSLKDKEVFSHPKPNHEVVTMLDGELDIVPESIYEDSYLYYVKKA